MSASTPPLNSIEGLRLVSSLLIVAGHYVPYVQMVNWISRFHLAVDLFFAISGIVIAYTYQGRVRNFNEYSNFMLRRLARLYPLHLVTLFFYVTIGLLALFGFLKADDMRKYNFDMLIPNLLLVHAWLPSGVISFNYVSWSISAEFFVYLLFPLISMFLANNLLRCIALLIAVVGFSMAMSQMFFGDSFTRLTWNSGILRAVPSFAFGVLICQHRKYILAKLAHVNIATIFHIACAITASLMILRAPDYMILPVIWLLAACGFFCDMNQRTTWLSHRSFSNYGYLTYSIYMLHTVVATIFIAVLFPKLFGVTTGARVISVLISFFILLAFSWYSYHYFEHPLRRWISKWGQSLPAAR
jgi:peptidoglycan/LPS O-acetylase OafA/YrhL